MDELEQCDSDDDKRSTQFRVKIFEKFALLFYYIHYVGTQMRQAIEKHSHCGKHIENSFKALSAQRNQLELLKETFVPCNHAIMNYTNI